MLDRSEAEPVSAVVQSMEGFCSGFCPAIVGKEKVSGVGSEGGEVIEGDCSISLSGVIWLGIG